MLFVYAILCLLGSGSKFILEVTSDPSPVDVVLAERKKVCMEAEDRADCISRGCTFACDRKLCLPIEHACMTNPASLCFHNCQDKDACTARPECTFDDVEQSCGGDDDAARSLELRSIEHFELKDNCRLKCVAGSAATAPQDCAVLPSLWEICHNDNRYKDHKCCYRFFTTTSTSTTTTSTTTTTTTETPSTTTTTTEEPITSTTEGPSTSTTEEDENISTTTEEPTTTPVTPVDPELEKYCNEIGTDHEACRKDPKCWFNCQDSICVSRGKFQTQCLQGCAAFCQDSCACKTAAEGRCEYNVILGLCFPREPECRPELFDPDECAKAGDYFARQGALCYNSEDRGKCDIVKNVFSGNTNGRRHTDVRDIEYMSDDEYTWEDVYNGRQEFYFAQSPLNTPDKYLFQSLISAIAHGNDTNQCIKFSIPLEEEGNYQLIVKTYEPFAKRLHRRLFNIVLDEFLIVPDLDIFAVVGKDFPMTITTNFKVKADEANSAKLLDMKGYGTARFADSVLLSFCVGDCRLMDGYFWEIGNYVASSFSVVKLA